jgi:hypothetical protein
LQKVPEDSIFKLVVMGVVPIGCSASESFEQLETNNMLLMNVNEMILRIIG